MGKYILLFLAVAIGYAIWQVTRRAANFRLLAQDGVDARGTVLRKYTLGRARRRNHYLEYRYADSRGESHTCKSNVGEVVWSAHAEGGLIEVTYSQSDPSVSAPRRLVHAAREALTQRNARGA